MRCSRCSNDTETNTSAAASPSYAPTSHGPAHVRSSSTSSASVALESVADICDRFVPNFYFGCEADDRLVVWAFAEHVNPARARLRPIFGSDISHWDVRDMTEPVEEAYSLVEDGLIGEHEFRELTFVNPARLHAGMNPEFFAGTVCEHAVRDVPRD